MMVVQTEFRTEAWTFELVTACRTGCVHIVVPNNWMIGPMPQIAAGTLGGAQRYDQSFHDDIVVTTGVIEPHCVIASSSSSLGMFKMGFTLDLLDV